MFLYGRLRDKIASKYPNLGAFADALGISRSSLSLKLNNQTDFTASEIKRACELLEIPLSNIPDYFFCSTC